MRSVARRPASRTESIDAGISEMSGAEELELIASTRTPTKPTLSEERKDERKDDLLVISKADAAGDQACWTTVLSSAFLGCGLLALVIFNSWRPPSMDADGIRKIKLHSFEYFIMCMIGGVFSGLPHTILCPLDVVKCRVQVGEYASMWEGFTTMYAEARRSHNTRHWVLSFLVLIYRGVAPTFIGYSLQGCLKFGLYEFFKYFYMGLNPAWTKEHKMLVFLAGSATAEFFADIALSPWEAAKIKMQTTRIYPPQLSVVMPRMWAGEGIAAFYKSIVPLWSRQIPYTMVKFTVFEKAVAFTYGYLVNSQSLGPRGHLAVSLACGCFAGALCAIVSHPSDTLVSKINQRGGVAAKQPAPVLLVSSTPVSSPSTAAAPGSLLPSGQATDALGIAKELGCSGLWKGLWVRVAFIGMLTAMQWVIYDSFKVAVGLPTTGSGTAKK